MGSSASVASANNNNNIPATATARRKSDGATQHHHHSNNRRRSSTRSTKKEDNNKLPTLYNTNSNTPVLVPQQSPHSPSRRGGAGLVKSCPPQPSQQQQQQLAGDQNSLPSLGAASSASSALSQQQHRRGSFISSLDPSQTPPTPLASSPSPPNTFLEEYGVGIAVIDMQHWRLVELVDKLMMSLDDVSSHQLGLLISSLAGSLQTHCRTDEILMTKSSYPLLAQRRAASAVALERCIKAATDLEESGGNRAQVVEGLVLFMNHWLLIHIKMDDKEMSRWVMEYNQNNPDANCLSVISPHDTSSGTVATTLTTNTTTTTTNMTVAMSNNSPHASMMSRSNTSSGSAVVGSTPVLPGLTATEQSPSPLCQQQSLVISSSHETTTASLDETTKLPVLLVT